MRNISTLASIELEICNESDSYNDAVASSNNELARMIHLSIQSLKRQREFKLRAIAKTSIASQ